LTEERGEQLSAERLSAFTPSFDLSGAAAVVSRQVVLEGTRPSPIIRVNATSLGSSSLLGGGIFPGCT
jgi:hypothetical protein